MTVVHTFDAAARRWPDRAAFVQGPRLVSYGEAAAASHRVALALLANGVGPDVKVAVLSPNEIDAFLCVLGTLRCGAVWQPTNARNSLEDNIAQFQDFDTEVLFYHSSFEADLARYRDACPKIRLTVCIDRAGAAMKPPPTVVAQVMTRQVRVASVNRHLAELILAAGDDLTATARKPESLDDLAAKYPSQLRVEALDGYEERGGGRGNSSRVSGRGRRVGDTRGEGDESSIDSHRRLR